MRCGRSVSRGPDVPRVPGWRNDANIVNRGCPNLLSHRWRAFGQEVPSPSHNHASEECVARRERDKSSQLTTASSPNFSITRKRIPQALSSAASCPLSGRHDRKDFADAFGRSLSAFRFASYRRVLQTGGLGLLGPIGLALPWTCRQRRQRGVSGDLADSHVVDRSTLDSAAACAVVIWPVNIATTSRISVRPKTSSSFCVA